MLTKIIADEKPTHVIAVLRSRACPRRASRCIQQYKAQRQTMPDDLRSQFALVRRILEAYRHPDRGDGRRRSRRRDRDAGAPSGARRGERSRWSPAISICCRSWTSARRCSRRAAGSPISAATIRRRCSSVSDLAPAQLPDYRGLKGDPSDNLPGIPGIGEKTAIKLIKAAGSLDALIANPSLAGTPKLEGADPRARRDGARLPRRLAGAARPADRRSLG